MVYRALRLGKLHEILMGSARSSAAVGIVIGAALILSYIGASENIPDALARSLDRMDLSPIVFLLGVNLLILVPGRLLDATTIILVIVPLFIPACREMGIDPLHFGVVIVVDCMIGLITPPSHARARDEICLLLQVEAAATLPNIEAIAATPGVDTIALMRGLTLQAP